MSRDGQAHRRSSAGNGSSLPPSVGRFGAMLHLIVRHLFEDGAAASIGRAQAVDMAAQMRFHLPFGLGDKAQAGAVAEGARERADREGARIPERDSAGWCGR